MIDLILSSLHHHAEKERAERSKAMFPTAMKIIGVRAAGIKATTDKCWEQMKDQTPEQLIKLAKELIKTQVIMISGWAGYEKKYTRN